MMRRLTCAGAGFLSGNHIRSVTQVPNKPNKGVKEPMQVPDRLKQAFSYFGVNSKAQDNTVEAYLPEGQRHGLLKDVMSQSENLINFQQITRLCRAFELSKNREPGHESWRNAMTLARTSNFCVELVRNETDVMPKGDKLWIDLNVCTERRRPYLFELEDGTLVLPIFTYENTANDYFSKNNVWEVTWFPHPKTGSQAEEFNKLGQPVMAYGSMKKMAMLATAALPHGRQVICMVDAISDHSKFLTYQEMLYISKATDAEGNVVQAAEPLQRCFDTRFWKGRRVDPANLPPRTPAEVKAMVPSLAEQELRLLVFDRPEVKAIYVELRDNAKWKQYLTKAPEKKVVMTVVMDEEHLSNVTLQEDLTDRLASWSYLSEMESDFATDITATAPQISKSWVEGGAQCIYEASAGELLRKHSYSGGPPIRERLKYDSPLAGLGPDDQKMHQPEMRPVPGMTPNFTGNLSAGPEKLRGNNPMRPSGAPKNPMGGSFDARTRRPPAGY